MSKYTDTSELRFGSVQDLYLELETRPLTEPFRSHSWPNVRKINNKVVKKEFRSTAITMRLPKAYSTVGYNIEHNIIIE